MTVFLWIRYLVRWCFCLPDSLLPRTCWSFRRLAAAVSAVLAPLVSTDACYGLDYSSYVSTGRGLFPQSLAAILLLLAIGYGFRAVRYGRRYG